MFWVVVAGRVDVFTWFHFDATIEAETFVQRLNNSCAHTLNIEQAHMTASQFMETISRNLFILIIVIEELLTQCDSSVRLVFVEMFEGTLNF